MLRLNSNKDADIEDYVPELTADPGAEATQAKEYGIGTPSKP